jgi:hypothetical protein
MEVASEQGAGSDRVDQSEGSGDSKTTSDNGGRVKIGAEAALASMSYDFGQSTVMKVHLASLESFTRYFPLVIWWCYAITCSSLRTIADRQGYIAS